jgi:cyclase
MLLPRLVPCLDCCDGRVVKGVRFRDLRDAGDPADLAGRYADAGADEIVLLDVAATVASRANAIATVAAVRAVLPIPLTVGGGVRTVDDAARLLDAGADKVAVNSAALARPALLGELAVRFGAQCVVVAIDAARTAAGGYEARSHAGGGRTGRDAVAWARDAVAAGAGEVLLTSVDRDGTGEGYDLELVRAVAAAVSAPVVASGGARGAEDLAAAFAAGADAALLASLLHDGRATVGQLKERLIQMGTEVRR